MTFTIREPIRPPLIPPVTMAIIKTGCTGGMLFSASISRKLAAWERKIVYREWRAVVFESMEKKYEITMILTGPPPIPKKADTIPSSNPMNTQKGI
jgi:hypothetical protein